MTVTTTAGPASATGATAGEYALTLLASFWLTIGLFLDGYAHEHLLDGDESFLTPWHLVFYSGFAAAERRLLLSSVLEDMAVKTSMESAPRRR